MDLLGSWGERMPVHDLKMGMKYSVVTMEIRHIANVIAAYLC